MRDSLLATGLRAAFAAITIQVAKRAPACLAPVLWQEWREQKRPPWNASRPVSRSRTWGSWRGRQRRLFFLNFSYNLSRDSNSWASCGRRVRCSCSRWFEFAGVILIIIPVSFLTFPGLRPILMPGLRPRRSPGLGALEAGSGYLVVVSSAASTSLWIAWASCKTPRISSTSNIPAATSESSCMVSS